MKVMITSLLMIIISSTTLHAAQSVILESDGYACMGDDKSRKQTEQSAFQDGKRKATEQASTYIQSETHVKDAVLEKDLLAAYANAQVKVLQEILKEWYKDTGLGECYRVRLKVEVLPDEKSMAAMAKKNQDFLESDPSAPLNVKVWTDKNEYRQGERVKVYIKANKPFFGRVVYELPSGDDRYDLEVSPPF